MEKNQLNKVSVWTLLVLAGLLLMHLLPDLTVAGRHLRRVDLLGDVRPPSPQETALAEDTLLLPAPKVKPAFVDTCRTGVTCIEDYCDSTRRGMTPFYRALDRAAADGRPVRIAVFGDSFIEGDIFTADLRDFLQSHYGGCGVGYVDIASRTNGYRPTVRHAFGGWRSHSVTDSLGFVRDYQGITCRYFTPTQDAYVELTGQEKYARHLDRAQQSAIYFRTAGTLSLSARINDERTEAADFTADSDVQQMRVRGDIRSVRWSVTRADAPTHFFGVTMEGTAGITLDNFSLRGSTGLSLAGIPLPTLRSFNRLRPYDLIILQYGLNVATERGRVYDKYRNGMMNTIAHLKAAFPQAGLLIVGVGDRDYRTEEGELRTMLGIKNLIRYQQNLAADNAIAFWNLFQAMGGEGSMSKLVDADPPMANLDYTHINFRGGRHLSELLYKALVEGKEQYDRRRAYETAE
jgi:hypothetical protein